MHILRNNMFALIKFKGVPKHYVCSDKSLIKKGVRTLVKWKSTYYEGNVVLQNQCYEVINDLARNLNLGLPKVLITKYSEESSLDQYKDWGKLPPEKIIAEDIWDFPDPFESTSDGDPSYELPSDISEDSDSEGEVDSIHEKATEESFSYVYLDNQDVMIEAAKEKLTEVYIDNQDDMMLTLEKRNVDGTSCPIKLKRVFKKHFCLYCQSAQSTLNRHLIRKHKEEVLVKEALQFNAGSKERLRAFELIRKQGDFDHNKTNLNNLVYVGKSNKAHATEFIPCPWCKGYYSRKNLKNHVRKNCLFTTDKVNKKRNILGKSRVLASSDVHSDACKELKEDFFPTIRNQQIFNIACSDPTVILMGNTYVKKYYKSSKHNFKLISCHLKHVCKLFLGLKSKVSLVTEVVEMLNPKYYDNIVETIHDMAGLKNGVYQKPSVAHLSCGVLSTLSKIVKCDAIKRNDMALITIIDRFLYLLENSQNADMTRIASETRSNKHRSKKVVLPSTNIICDMINALEECISTCYNILKTGFDQTTWRELSGIQLAKIMVFNRKRPGDVQRALLSEFNSLDAIEEEQVHNLPEDLKQYAKEYHTFITRHKLNTSASIILSKKDVATINLLLKYRDEVNVPPTNNYLFADPWGKRCDYFQADLSLKKFCEKNKLPYNPATLLRKHVATHASTRSQDQQKYLSDFMGHDLQIHNNIYRQKQPSTDILMMVPILKAASGIKESTVVPRQVQNDKHHEEINKDPSTRDEEQQISQDLFTSPNEIEEKGAIHVPLRPVNLFGGPRNQRKTWTTPERKKVLSHFGDYFKKGKMPSLAETQTKLLLPSFQDVDENGQPKFRRSLPQVRAWIHSELKRMDLDTKGVKRKGWSDPQKRKCREFFKKYYEGNAITKYPSTAELEKAVDTIKEFHQKSPAEIRAHIQHDFKYMGLKVQRFSV